MVERDLILKEVVWFVGITNIKDVYNYAYEWLRSEDFTITEDKYKEVVKGDEKELEIKWVVNKKISDYFRANLEFMWKVLGMKDVEVEIDGKKKKMNKVAELTIKINGKLEKDYNSKWGPSSIQTFFKDLYHKYVIPQRTEQMEDKVREYVQVFKEEMKAYLELTGKRQSGN